MFNGVESSGWLYVEASVHVDNLGTHLASQEWRTAIKIAVHRSTFLAGDATLRFDSHFRRKCQSSILSGMFLLTSCCIMPTVLPARSDLYTKSSCCYLCI